MLVSCRIRLAVFLLVLPLTFLLADDAFEVLEVSRNVPQGVLRGQYRRLLQKANDSIIAAPTPIEAQTAKAKAAAIEAAWKEVETLSKREAYTATLPPEKRTNSPSGVYLPPDIATALERHKFLGGFSPDDDDAETENRLSNILRNQFQGERNRRRSDPTSSVPDNYIALFVLLHEKADVLTRSRPPKHVLDFVDEALVKPVMSPWYDAALSKVCALVRDRILAENFTDAEDLYTETFRRYLHLLMERSNERETLDENTRSSLKGWFSKYESKFRKPASHLVTNTLGKIPPISVQRLAVKTHPTYERLLFLADALDPEQAIRLMDAEAVRLGKEKAIHTGAAAAEDALQHKMLDLLPHAGDLSKKVAAESHPGTFTKLSQAQEQQDDCLRRLTELQRARAKTPEQPE